MFSRLLLCISIFLLGGCDLVFAQEVISSFEEENIAVLNGELRKVYDDLDDLLSADYALTGDEITGILPTEKGGTNNDLSSSTNGQMLVYDSVNDEFDAFGQGTSGQVLTSAGSGSNPTWVSQIVKDFELIYYEYINKGASGQKDISITDLDGEKVYIMALANGGYQLAMTMNSDTGPDYDYYESDGATATNQTSLPIGCESDSFRVYIIVPNKKANIVNIGTLAAFSNFGAVSSDNYVQAGNYDDSYNLSSIQMTIGNGVGYFGQIWLWELNNS